MARVEFDQELERLETEIKIMASTVCLLYTSDAADE